VSRLSELGSSNQLLPNLAIHPFFIHAKSKRRKLRKRIRSKQTQCWQISEWYRLINKACLGTLGSA
jgi:hypothetical protein